jgi:hypothetical protein
VAAAPGLPSAVPASSTRLAAALAATAHLRPRETAFDVASRIRGGRTLYPTRLRRKVTHLRHRAFNARSRALQLRRWPLELRGGALDLGRRALNLRRRLLHRWPLHGWVGSIRHTQLRLHPRRSR